MTSKIQSLRTTQIAFFRFATLCGFFRGSADEVTGSWRGTKSIRARVHARENQMKPFVKTSFLGTRPSCLPSHGRPLFDTTTESPFYDWAHRQPSKYAKTSKMNCAFTSLDRLFFNCPSWIFYMLYYKSGAFLRYNNSSKILRTKPWFSLSKFLKFSLFMKALKIGIFGRFLAE